MLTDNPNDPRLGRGVDKEPRPQNDVYLVLSEEERQKGFVRPLRRAYVHRGLRRDNPLRDLTTEELKNFGEAGYVKFETYPAGSDAIGRFWTQAELDNRGCGTITTMGLALCETYARDPGFYGSTYCTGCSKHLRLGEFRWIESDGTEGPEVGS